MNHRQKYQNRHEGVHPGELVQIAGSGPAGLAAAITLVRAGYKVVVHEAQREVGHRFQGDLQGLENWSKKKDVLDELDSLGITTDFDYIPCNQGSCYDAWGREYRMKCNEPLYYMVRRGPGSGTLDTALLNQARSLGVEVRFNSRIDHIEGHGILATGPKVVNAIAAGYHFETDLKNGFWVICDNDLAPKGYAYLLVMNGWGTVKSCMYSGFKQEKHYVQLAVAAFERLVGLHMINPKPHGGVINSFLPTTALSGENPVAGEQAGFQDGLWGFGMRMSIASGVLAAHSLIDGSDYDAAWKQELAPLMRTSVVNRAIFGYMGNRGYRWFLNYLYRQPDARDFLCRQYNPSFIKSWLFPLVNIKMGSGVKGGRS